MIFLNIIIIKRLFLTPETLYVIGAVVVSFKIILKARICNTIQFMEKYYEKNSVGY